MPKKGFKSIVVDDDAYDEIEDIQQWTGLRSRSEVVRIAVRSYRRSHNIPRKDNEPEAFGGFLTFHNGLSAKPRVSLEA